MGLLHVLVILLVIGIVAPMPNPNTKLIYNIVLIILTILFIIAGTGYLGPRFN